jgi:hypothetical protein
MMHRTASQSASGGRIPAILSIVIGLVGLAVALIEPTLAVVLGLAGFFLGMIGRRTTSAHGLAIGGLVLNVAVLMLVIVLVATTTGTHHGYGIGT